MRATPVIAIFDVGKTNKKLFLFDENYKIVFERSARFTETTDELFEGDIALLAKQRAKSVATLMEIKIAQNKKPRN